MPAAAADTFPRVTLAEALRRSARLDPDYVRALGQIEDAEWGRAVWAFVTGDVSEDEIVEHCRGLLPGFKVPKRAVVLEVLPRTASGKVERPSLESRAHDLRQGR